LFSPLIRGIIDFLAKSKAPDYGLSAENKVPLATVSGAQIDRLLAPARKALEMRGISTTRAAGAAPRSQVPAQTHFDRKAAWPGDFAFDTVAHCGAWASGQFCKTLTGTSLYSGWVEERSLLNGANKWLCAIFLNFLTNFWNFFLNLLDKNIKTWIIIIGVSI
jgi:hypothetical protein